MEIICIDDNYSVDILEFWSKYGVVYPRKDLIDNIREVITHSNGQTGIRLDSIKNPEIPVKHPILGNIMYEPTFNIKRFRKLNGDKILKEELKEILTLQHG